ncbi:MAG: hypothetical protein JWM40_755 [Frankiales bacterium]|nr:hypothetical protein [Frankiales bacterium]
MPERYVRPPLIAREAPNQAFAVWRFRIVALLVLLILAVLVGYGMIKALGIGNEDPGFGGSARHTITVPVG